jgi:hypothetical protein
VYLISQILASITKIKQEDGFVSLNDEGMQAKIVVKSALHIWQSVEFYQMLAENIKDANFLRKLATNEDKVRFLL